MYRSEQNIWLYGANGRLKIKAQAEYDNEVAEQTSSLAHYMNLWCSSLIKPTVNRILFVSVRFHKRDPRYPRRPIWRQNNMRCVAKHHGRFRLCCLFLERGRHGHRLEVSWTGGSGEHGKTEQSTGRCICGLLRMSMLVLKIWNLCRCF